MNARDGGTKASSTGAQVILFDNAQDRPFLNKQSLLDDSYNTHWQELEELELEELELGEWKE